jgi:hypothetical protein
LSDYERHIEEAREEGKVVEERGEKEEGRFK